MKVIKGIGAFVIIAFLVAGCGQQQTLSPADNPTNTTDTSTSNVPDNSDTKAYAADMKPLIDEYMSVMKSYTDFVAAFNKGQYQPAAVINQMSTYEMQLSDVQTKAMLVTAPSSMTANQQLFQQSVTDFLNGATSMDYAATHSITGSAKQDIINSNNFTVKATTELQTFLQNVNDASK